MQLSLNNQVSATVQPLLNFFVQSFQPGNLSFPLMPNTYTLWRNYAFQNMKKLQSYKQHTKNCIYEFYLISQTRFVKIFIQKLLKNIEITSEKGKIGPSIPQQYRIGNYLIQKYYKSLYEHSLYSELFQDLIKLPYLNDTFPSTRKYKLAEQYIPNRMDFKQKKEENSFSDGLLSKGVGFLTQKIFTKTFLFKASSIAFKFNPIAILASFAYAEYINSMRKQKKGAEITQKLAEVVQDIEQKVELLKNAYQQCIGFLGNGLKNGGSDKQRAIFTIKQIMIQDWLQIQTYKDEEGWEVVVLNNLQNIQSEDKKEQFQL